MALSNTMKVAIFFMFWWYVYLFLTLRSPVLRKMPRYSIAIVSAPHGKLVFKNNDDDEMRNERNKIKSDPTQEIILYF